MRTRGLYPFLKKTTSWTEFKWRYKNWHALSHLENGLKYYADQVECFKKNPMDEQYDYPNTSYLWYDHGRMMFDLAREIRRRKMAVLRSE